MTGWRKRGGGVKRTRIKPMTTQTKVRSTEEALKLALEALENNKQTHYYCEDTWYSCPQHEDGCANDSVGDECNCGADKANAEIDKAITAIKEALSFPNGEAQPEQRSVSEHLEPVAFPDAPQTIYLQVGDECPDDAKWKELIDVCWCDEQVFDNDIVYVRADTTTPQPQSKARGLSQSKPLTDEQIYEIHENSSNLMEFTRAIEAAHGVKEKNDVSR